MSHLRPFIPLAVLAIGVIGSQDLTEQHRKHPIGYRDTPVLPGSSYRVHDLDRPHAAVVRPGAKFSENARPPADALVLFDGTDLSEWNGGRWKVENGYMEVNGTGNVKTRRTFGDCQLHLEWRTPDPPELDSQQRGNSGVFFFGLYEVQILDSHENVTYADGQAGALYGQCPPIVNASRPPGEWQTYDIVFRAPRFSGQEVDDPGFITVIHNGVVIHHHRAFIGRTAHRAVGEYQAHGPKGSLVIQDHRDNQAMRFRNIWIRELGEYDQQ